MSVTQIQTNGIDNDAVTLEKINFENALVPVGGIIMWSGTTVPTGWSLCNGSNGTPDLRNRFIVGANSTSKTGTTSQTGPGFNASNGALSANYTPGDIGGSTAHRLTTAQMPSHGHNYKDGYWSGQGLFGDGPAAGTNSSTDYDNYIVNRFLTTDPSGGGNYHENRPPYYALAFIMRVS
jgi:microcystin-dependent protein